MKNITKASFKSFLMRVRAPWIKTGDEQVIGLHEALFKRQSIFNKDVLLVQYGEQHGYLRLCHENSYVVSYLTDSGLALAKELATKICAFSGKKI